MKRILCLLFLFAALPLHAEEAAPPAGAQAESKAAEVSDDYLAVPWVTSREGCRMMSLYASEGAEYRWSGACKDGHAEGRGVLSIYEDGKLVEKSRVSYRRGVPDGLYVSERLHDEEVGRSEQEFRDGKPHGKHVRHYRNGDVLTIFVENGRPTGRMEFARKGREHFVGEMLEDGMAKGSWVHPDGSRYEGVAWRSHRHGYGKWIPKDGPVQEGEFILDEFVDIADESARKLMPAKFGLEFGMTRQQVEKLTGKLNVNEESQLRNAFEVEHFPDEKLGTQNFVLGKRVVYFDDSGKLWRVWVEILLQPDTYFGGAEVMQDYGAIRRWLSLNFRPDAQEETFPHVGAGLDACIRHADWEKNNPESFRMASEAAPLMAPSQRVIFDIGCHAIAPWSSVFRNEAGERFGVYIRYGNLYATPLAYTAAVADEEAMFEKMRKQSAKR